jgi:hypothetical protein
MRIGDKPGRLRVNGRASVSFDDPLIEGLPGAQMLVSLTPTDIFPNCPRYIPALTMTAPSIYSPEAGVDPIEPAWKSFDAFKDVAPPRAR